MMLNHKKLGLALAAYMGFAAGLQADYKEGYYDAMDGMMKERLKEAAKRCVADHTRLNYTDLPNYWVLTDTYPERDGGELRFWDMYSSESYLIHPDETGRQAFSRNKMQREHAVPKSWWKVGDDVEYTPAYSDLWNLYPSDGPANQAKNNYPLGPVATASFDNGVTKVGSPQAGFGGGCKSVFEPADDYKGDFARAYFYMATVYDDLAWKYTYMFKTEEWPTLQPWAMDMLLDWARRDPVSDKEIARNDAVENCQGNRNPFIDFPSLAEYVWGDLTDEVFLIGDQQGGVDAIGVGDAPAWRIGDGGLHILSDCDTPLTLTDLAGRTLMRVAAPRSGDFLPLPCRGILIIRCGTTTQKIAN
ncbi:MAG: endonuclease [Bacteroidales bacterium]|nr:endonuclease [Bacteroidales bacterium]